MRIINLLSTLLLICTPVLLKAQAVEVELNVGVHESRAGFSHSSQVTKVRDGFQSSGNRHYLLAVSTPLHGNAWYLRSEIGLIKTNSFLMYKYTYDEGLGEMFRNRISYLTNKKLHLSILPEYRIHANAAALKIYGGILLTSDIANIRSTTNEILLPKSNPLGICLGASFQFPINNNIALSGGLRATRLGNSELQNEDHPKINYLQYGMNVGLAYRFASHLEKDEEVKGVE